MVSSRRLAFVIAAAACNRLSVGDDSGAPDVSVALEAGLDATGACGVQASAPWPMVAHDPARTGRSTFDGPRTAQIRWTFAYPDRDFDSSPAVAADGTIYLELLYGALLAIDPDGKEKWSVSGVGSYGSPTIGCDGTIFVEGPHRNDGEKWVDDLLMAFTPAGSSLWTLTDVAPIGMDDNGPAPSNGILYYARSGLYGIGFDGKLRFHLTGYAGSPRVAVDDAGVAYGGIEQSDDGGAVLSFGPDGGVRWQHDGAAQGMLLDDGSFVAANDHAITAYSSAGAVLWSTPAHGTRTLAAASSGRIYAGTSDGIVALDAVTHASKLLHAWSDYYAGYFPSVVVDASGWVYGSLNHHVLAFTPDDALAFDVDLGADYIDGTSLALSNGTLYVATYEHLIAFGP